MENQKGSIFKGSLLIAGTAIGGGMLALPVLTSMAGFFPSLFIYVLCWLFMACTGLLLLEVCLWLKGDSNIVSMAEHTIGKGGKAAAWMLYILLFYCLTVAYMVGCGNLVVDFFHGSIPDWLGSVLFVVIFSPFILMETQTLGRFNAAFVFGLALAFLAFIVMGASYVNSEHLMAADWSKAVFTLPIAFTAFAYHGIIPTLVHYMHDDARQSRIVILIGTTIPLLAYIVWEWLILGIVPIEGVNGLSAARELGYNAVMPLKNFIDNPLIYTFGQYLAFFALITSYLGVTVGLRDFLADGLKVKKDQKGKLLLSALIFIPPLLIAIAYPHVFLTALDYAGGFGCALLLGLFPILMVWAGRYHLNLKGEPQLPGGRVILIILMIFVLFEVAMETWHVMQRIDL
jgi:tyrosine-specific transport protein